MGHEHGHNHGTGSNKKVLLLSFIIIATYMVIEAIGGFIVGSLAILSDAGHMLSDAISLGVALIAITLGNMVANHNKTYGYKRFEVLAAVFNGITLILVSLFVFYEAIQRFQTPTEIASSGMLIIAVIGLLVNILVAWMMMRGGDVKDNINMLGAYLHVLSDILGSVGAIVAALLIMFFDWGWADLFASVFVGVLVLRSGLYITKSGLHILMEGTPLDVNVEDVIKTIKNVDGVQSVHDLHIWSITSGLNALSCHAVVDERMTVAGSEALLRKIEHDLEHINVQHMTIQLETPAHQHDDEILCTAKSGSSGHHHHHHH